MDNTFRRVVSTDSKNSGAGKGSRKAYWEVYKFPKDSSSAVWFAKAQYPDPEAIGVTRPDYKFKKHVRQVQGTGNKPYYRDIVCSAGWDKFNPQPCAGCYYNDAGDKSVSPGNLSSALTIVHLAVYHGHPFIGENGQVVMKRDNSGPVMIQDECGYPNCNFCRVMQGQQPVLQQGDQFPNIAPNSITMEFGKRRYIEVGKSHLSNLLGWDKAIGERCGTCRAKTRPTGMYCPTCNTPIIDFTQQPAMLSQLENLITSSYPCHTCNAQVFLNTTVTCDPCAQAGRQMSTLGLFDVVVSGMRQGEGNKSQMMMTNWDTIEQFEQQIPQQYLQGKKLSQLLQELGQPYDFNEMLKPLPPQEQVKRLGYQQSAPQQQQPMYQQAPVQGPPQPAFGPYANAPQVMPQPQFPQPQAVQPQVVQQQVGPGPVPFMVPPKPNFGQ